MPRPPKAEARGSNPFGCANNLVVNKHCYFSRHPPPKAVLTEVPARLKTSDRNWSPLMKTRPLGRTGIDIAPLVLGGNVFGWTADEATSFAILDRFAEAGLNAIDTADVYSSWATGNKGGESETIIGKWMKSRANRNRMVIITKVGSDMGPEKKA